MKSKLLIIDGSSMLAEAYYSSITNEVNEILNLEENGNLVDNNKKYQAYSTLLQFKNGGFINGVQRFLRLFFDVIDKRKPSYVVVAWGCDREDNFRRKLYPQYKNDGKKKDFAFYYQEELLQEMLKDIGVYQLVGAKEEALDVAGRLANNFHKEFDVEIWARNYMSLQFLDIANVLLKVSNYQDVILKYGLDDTSYPIGSVLFDKKLLRRHFCLEPFQMPDYRALKGHSFTNIPGVKTVGHITATSLLEEYGDLESIYYDIDFCKTKEELIEFGENLKINLMLPFNPIPSLIKNKEDALLGKELATYKRNWSGDLNSLDLNQLDVKNISKIELVKSLKYYYLSAIKGNLTKKLIELVNKSSFSSLLATYNPSIFSPSSPCYIKTDSYLKNIPYQITVEGEIYELVHVSLDAILSFGNKLSIDIPKENYQKLLDSSTTNSSSEETNNTIEVFEVNNVANEDKESGINQTGSDDVIVEDNSNTGNTHNNSNNIDESVSENNSNITENNSLTETNNNNQKFLQFKDKLSFDMNFYHCDNCNSDFALIGATASFCTNCGVKIISN